MFKCIFKLIFTKEIKEIFSRLKQKYEDLLKLYIHKEECYQESLKTIDKLQKQIDGLKDLINSNSNFFTKRICSRINEDSPITQFFKSYNERNEEFKSRWNKYGRYNRFL